MNVMKEKNSELAVLRKRVAKVPHDPGVYRWLNKSGEVLYVGKAKSLRKRMQTYVSGKAKNSPWTEIMVRQIADFEVTIVRSELEAFMLESNLIKKLRPKYNIMLKDDKGYVYVRVSDEQFPRIDVVRRLESDGAKYFGPFTSGMQSTERTLEMLDSVLHFRACGKSIDALNAGKTASDTPCLDYQIGRCNGLCIGAIHSDEYQSRIKAVISFFRGNFSEMRKIAAVEMKRAAEEKKFEKAARLRDAVSFIEDLEKRQAIADTSGEDIDVFGIAERGGKRQAVLIRQRDGKVIDELTFALKGEAESSADAMEQLLPQFYGETQDVPSTILLRDELSGRSIIEEWFRAKKGKAVKLLTPERGRKSRLLEMAEKNAEEKVEQQFASWEAETKKVEGALAELAKIISLKRAPRRIEGYDISHLGGTATVGSMVVFSDGKPKREHYRSFNITTVKHGDIDDYKALAETLKRRLKYLVDDTEALKARGITLRKAKKADQKSIETIVKEHPNELDDKDLSYKEFLVALKEGELVAFGRIHAHKGGVAELSSIFVAQSERGSRLGQIVVKSLLASTKAKKVYAVLKEDLEDYYGELGFQIVRTAPDIIMKQAASCGERCGKGNAIIMMFEVRKKKDDASFSAHPDLLLIDGGKGHLSSAVEALRSLGLSIPVAGLAKREEEIFLPGQSDPIAVPKGSEARFLLQRVRDEAHRFANAKREKRLESSIVSSALDDVKGIGEDRKKQLIKQFGSLDAALRASDEELGTILSGNQIQIFRQSGK